jgi:hypothetical protein
LRTWGLVYPEFATLPFEHSLGPIWVVSMSGLVAQLPWVDGKKGAAGQCATWNSQVASWLRSASGINVGSHSRSVRQVGAFHSTNSMVISLDMSMS